MYSICPQIITNSRGTSHFFATCVIFLLGSVASCHPSPVPSVHICPTRLFPATRWTSKSQTRMMRAPPRESFLARPRLEVPGSPPRGSFQGLPWYHHYSSIHHLYIQATYDTLHHVTPLHFSGHLWFFGVGNTATNRQHIHI